MRNKRNIKKASGFSLAEMMITLTIMMIASASLLPLMVFVSKSSFSNENIVTANNLASSRMEEIRALEYEQIGTIGGNPEGNIHPEEYNLEINGVQYDVQTFITWGSAEGKSGINPVAFKNVHITVKGLRTFTGAKEVLAELYSTFSRDGEEPLIDKGHIQVKVRDTLGMPVNTPLLVSISGPVRDSLYTEYDGSAFFGLLDSGIYSVEVRIPNDMFAIGGDAIDPIENTVQKCNIVVENYSTTQVDFVLEKKSKACYMELQFVNSDNGNVITNGGKLSLLIAYGEESYVINREFTSDDFSDDILTEEIIGPLPAGAVCMIKTSNISGYMDYNMAAAATQKPTVNETSWNGKLSEAGSSISVTVPLKDTFVYEESTSSDFDNSYYSELVVSDNNTLILYSGSIENVSVGQPSESSSYNNKNVPSNAFDGNTKTNWESRNENISPDNPEWLQVEFENAQTINSFKLTSKKNKAPKDFYVKVSMDGIVWENVKNVNPTTFTNTKDEQTVTFDPVLCRYFSIYFTSSYSTDKSDKLDVSELGVFTIDGYAQGGYRIAGPIDISGYQYAPYFRVYWDVDNLIENVTEFEVRILMLDEGIEPAKSDFNDNTIVENGGVIPGIPWGSNLNGKRLWIVESFISGDKGETPVLNWLRIDDK